MFDKKNKETKIMFNKWNSEFSHKQKPSKNILDLDHNLMVIHEWKSYEVRKIESPTFFIINAFHKL